MLCTYIFFSTKNKDIILSLYISLIRPHMAYAVQFWSLHHAKDIANLEAVQRRATQIIHSLPRKFYEKRLAWLNLFSFSRKVVSEENSYCFKTLKGFMNVDANQLFLNDDLSLTRSNELKLRCRQIELNCTKFFFTNDVVRESNKFPPSVVQCNKIISLKTNLITRTSKKVSDKDQASCCLFDYVYLWLLLCWIAFPLYIVTLS